MSKYIPKPGTYCTYVYRDPSRNNEPIYVGKGTRGRAYKHLLRSDMHPFVQRLQLMKKNGVQPLIEFAVRDTTSEDAVSHEIRLISEIGRKDLGLGPLLNLTDGGEGNVGAKCSEEHRRKVSEAHKGLLASEETKRKMSIARAGRKISDAHRQNISAGKKKPCTIDGITIYASVKDLVAALGTGKTGVRSTTFRIIDND